MNAFYEHHQDSIRFHYRCFDRILLNAIIPSFLLPQRALGFFSQYRHLFPVTPQVLKGVAQRNHEWMVAQAQRWGVDIFAAPEGRRDEFMEPYFRRAQPDRVVGIIKAREPAWILTSVPGAEGCHLEPKRRWVEQYNVYVRDAAWGPMFVRVCPYFPFAARLCLNQHHWLAERLKQEGVRCVRDRNAFLGCADPEALQRLADALNAADLLSCARKWLTRLVPFFTREERLQRGCQHELFFFQVEYCDNLIFRRRAVLDALQERLLDANRSLGQPATLAVIFGRRVSRRHRGQLQTTIEDLHLGNPLIRSHYKSSVGKQYVRSHLLDRVELGTNDVKDLRLPDKSVRRLPELRQRMQQVTENYRNVQQDILETYLDRGQLHELSRPTVTPGGKRTPGLHFDHPRQIALMHALVRFCHLVNGGVFTTAQIYPAVRESLGLSANQYKLNALRYDLSKLRAKGLLEKIPHSRRYRLTGTGYRLCVVYLKLFEKIHAPLAAGILKPFSADAKLSGQQLTRLDRLYRAVTQALDELIEGVGVRLAA